MIKWIGMLAAGVALGAGAVLLTQLALDDKPTPALRPIEAPAPAPRPAPATSPGTEVVSLAQIHEMYGFERTAALYGLLQAADASSIEALIEEATAPDLAWTRWGIVSRYVDLDPRAALNHLVSKKPIEASHVHRAFTTWAREDLDAAVAFAEALDQPLRTQLGNNLLSTLSNLSDARQDEIARRLSVDAELTGRRAISRAASDPGGAWLQALAMKPGESRTRALSAVARRWFDQDPEPALTALNSVADDKQRTQLQRQLLVQWVGTDREAALRWSASQPSSAERTTLLTAVAAAAAKDSPVEVLEFAKTLGPKERREVARQALHVWSRSDPRAALAALDQMDDARLTQRVQHTLVNRWAQSDPLEVLDWARPRPASGGRTQALTIAIGKVAKSDPTEALALAEDLDSGARPNAIESVLSQWGRDDSRAAAAWLDGSPHKTPGTVAAVVNGFAALDAEEALDWLRTQSVEAQRRLTPAILWHVGEESPEAAFEMMDRIDDPTTTTNAGSQLVSRWARDDPHAAVRAIARLGDDSRAPLYQAAFGSWARHDPEAATAYVDRIPASDRDGAINGVLQYTLYSGSVETAEELFDRLVDKETRRNAATTMFLHLSRTDPKRAERYREMSAVTIAEDGSMTYTIPARGW